MSTFPFESYHEVINQAPTIRRHGRVTQVLGLIIEATGPRVGIGEVCNVTSGGVSTPCEVVGFRRDSVLLMPLLHMEGIRPGAEVVPTGAPFLVPAGEALLGRLLDGLGNPIDDGPPLPDAITRVSIQRDPPSPFTRKRIQTPLETGIRGLDSLLTLGRGQRIGIFAGSGVGKSTLLGMIARGSKADVNVIGLVGERGREVREFVEKDLGPEGLRRSVVIVATSDRPALVRVKAAMAATAVAEYFRDQGKDVMLMMDSVTRFALSQREIGLAVGEPPTTRGYTPSVFALLPKLMERAGTAKQGSITALYTVLVEGGDMDEPVADAVRGILDGHIVLTRELAMQNIYPAIDVLQSISRLMPEITNKRHYEIANQVKDLLATYQQSADLINIGAYKPGSNPKVDQAVARLPRIQGLIKQGILERTTFEQAVAQLEQVVS